MTHMCLSIPVLCHLEVSKSSPACACLWDSLSLEHFLLLFQPLHPCGLDSSWVPPLPKCFICISLLAFTCPLLRYIALFLYFFYISYISWASVERVSTETDLFLHFPFMIPSIIPLWEFVLIKIFAMNYIESYYYVGTKQWKMWCWWSSHNTGPICLLLPVPTCCQF